MPIKFKGIQQFIRYASSIGYVEDPDYKELNRLVVFDAEKEVERKHLETIEKDRKRVEDERLAEVERVRVE